MSNAIFLRLRALVVLVAIIGLVACEPKPEDKQAVKDLFKSEEPPAEPPLPVITPPGSNTNPNPAPTPNPEPNPVPGPGSDEVPVCEQPETPAAVCHNERFRQPDSIITKKVDILFVTDTSGSLDDERAGIADGISAFVNELPSDADYNIAVLLAHSSKGLDVGKIYQFKSEPHVLESSKLSLTDIRKHLLTKLTKARSDFHGDGGELGLFSLSRGLDADLVYGNDKTKFLRDDAALAVIFISDENDVCAVYPQGVTPVPDYDNLEISAFARDCSGISAGGVLQKLKNAKKGLPLLIGGIIYNNPATVPAGGENEVGYGYTDIISLSNGVSIDMASGRYQEGLSTIGALTTIKLNLLSEFKLTRNGFDVPTMQVSVDGGRVTFDYEASINEVRPHELGRGGSYIDVGYCMPVVIPEPVDCDTGGGGTGGGGTGGGGTGGGGTGGGGTGGGGTGGGGQCPYVHPDDLNCDGRHDQTGELLF